MYRLYKTKDRVNSDAMAGNLGLLLGSPVAILENSDGAISILAKVGSRYMIDDGLCVKGVGQIFCLPFLSTSSAVVAVY
jgi:hypothetical protein